MQYNKRFKLTASYAFGFFRSINIGLEDSAVLFKVVLIERFLIIIGICVQSCIAVLGSSLNATVLGA